jgi:hypothetical protein
MMHPSVAGLSMRRPIDWQRPSTFRIREIVTSSYILASTRAWIPPRNAGTLEDEIVVMTAWANNLTLKDGIKVIYQGADMRVLQIVNRAKVSESLRRLVADHQWRKVFNEANADFLTEDDVIKIRFA